jgi:DNA ligase (NAD+)
VIIRKAGAIIPEIVSSVARRIREEELVAFHGNEDVNIPYDVLEQIVAESLAQERPPFDLVAHIGGKCPSCGSADIEKQETLRTGRAIGKSTSNPAKLQVAYRCGNTAGCRAQLSGRIEHMASRDCLNLSQMGEALCDEIAFRTKLEIDNFDHPFDLFNVATSWFANLSWTTESGGQMTFGESRAMTLKLAMEAAKSLPLRHWIAALGIHTVGKNTSKEISRLCKNASELITACTDTDGLFRRMVLLNAAGKQKEFDELKEQYAISHHLGPVSLMALVNFATAHADILARIPETAVSDNYAPEPSSAPAGNGGPLSGRVFVVTGTLSEPRNNIHAAIEAAGGIVASSISAKTNVLVAGDKAGSKMAKAAKLGVEVWNEERLRREMEQ